MSATVEQSALISRAENGWLIYRDAGLNGRPSLPYVARDAAGAIEIAAQMLGVDMEVRR
jgi:hypothetical protein